MAMYLCRPDDGPEKLVGTQAEAKALDRNYKEHVVPTDKQGLMGYVNGLLARIRLADEALVGKVHGVEAVYIDGIKVPDAAVQRVADPLATVPLPGNVGSGRVDGVITADGAVVFTKAASVPNSVTVTHKMPATTVDIMNRTAIEEALWATDEHGLKNLEDAIMTRRQELAENTVPVVSPPKRRRAA